MFRGINGVFTVERCVEARTTFDRAAGRLKADSDRLAARCLALSVVLTLAREVGQSSSQTQAEAAETAASPTPTPGLANPGRRPNPTWEVVMSWTRLVIMRKPTAQMRLWSCLLGIAAVVAFTLVCAAVASASTISGSGSGVTIPRNDGSYTMVGTWVDGTSGTHGTYEGSYTPVSPADFTSCEFFSPIPVPCENDCNRVFGSLQFRSHDLDTSVDIARLEPFSMTHSSKFYSVVCQQTVGSPEHTLDFFLNFSPGPCCFPVTVGGLSGTSVPLGSSSVYRDNFTFSLTL